MSPTAPTSTSRPHSEALRRRPVVLRPDEGRALDAVRDRAGVRAHARADGVPASTRTHEEEAPNAKGGVDTRTVLRLDPRARAGEGRGAAAVAQRPAVAESRRNSPPTCASCGTSTSTTPARSAAATAARTRSARRSASRSTSTPSTTTRSPCASATRWGRSGSRSRGCGRTWPSGSRVAACGRCSALRLRRPRVKFLYVLAVWSAGSAAGLGPQAAQSIDLLITNAVVTMVTR